MEPELEELRKSEVDKEWSGEVPEVGFDKEWSGEDKEVGGDQEVGGWKRSKSELKI